MKRVHSECSQEYFKINTSDICGVGSSIFGLNHAFGLIGYVHIGFSNYQMFPKNACCRL